MRSTLNAPVDREALAEARRCPSVQATPAVLQKTDIGHGTAPRKTAAIGRAQTDHGFSRSRSVPALTMLLGGALGAVLVVRGLESVDLGPCVLLTASVAGAAALTRHSTEEWTR